MSEQPAGLLPIKDSRRLRGTAGSAASRGAASEGRCTEREAGREGAPPPLVQRERKVPWCQGASRGRELQPRPAPPGPPIKGALSPLSPAGRRSRGVRRRSRIQSPLRRARSALPAPLRGRPRAAPCMPVLGEVRRSHTRWPPAGGWPPVNSCRQLPDRGLGQHPGAFRPPRAARLAGPGGGRCSADRGPGAVQACASSDSPARPESPDLPTFLGQSRPF